TWRLTISTAPSVRLRRKTIQAERREGAQLHLDNTAGSWLRRAHAIARDPVSSTAAGTADPPTMNRWVKTAPTIVGMSRSAPNAAQAGTRSATAETTAIEPVT